MKDNYTLKVHMRGVDDLNSMIVALSALSDLYGEWEIGYIHMQDDGFIIELEWDSE